MRYLLHHQSQTPPGTSFPPSEDPQVVIWIAWKYPEAHSYKGLGLSFQRTANLTVHARLFLKGVIEKYTCSLAVCSFVV